MVKFPKVKTGKLFDFFKTVNKGVSVHKKLAACFGNVKVVFKEFLNGEKGFLVKAFNRTFFENLAKEHFTKRCGKLIDKTRNAKVIVAYNGLVGVEHLADLKSDLRFLKALCQILYACGGGADAHVYSGKELAA